MFTTPDGWSVEPMDLELTTRERRTVQDPVGDGWQFLIRYRGKTIAFVRTVAELAKYCPSWETLTEF